jgi:hypothetical protein
MDGWTDNRTTGQQDSEELENKRRLGPACLLAFGFVPWVLIPFFLFLLACLLFGLAQVSSSSFLSLE